MRAQTPTHAPTAGRAALSSAALAVTPLVGAILVFSVFVNVLMLTGPIFMLQVYDRVLGSQSEATLVALFALVAFLYAMMGIIDYARGRVLARAGARFQTGLDQHVFQALLHTGAAQGGAAGARGLQDLEAIQRFSRSPALLAMFDIPWTPVFLAAIFVFHPFLGWLAIAGGGGLILAAIRNQVLTRARLRNAHAIGAEADTWAAQVESGSETVRALGMGDAVFARWKRLRDTSLADGLSAADRAGIFSAFSKASRLLFNLPCWRSGPIWCCRGN